MTQDRLAEIPPPFDGLGFIDDVEDVVNDPRHYKIALPDGQKIEAIDYIQAVLGHEGAVAYCHGSALKYLSRAGRKDNFEQDLRKAAWFCTKAAQIHDDMEMMDK